MKRIPLTQGKEALVDDEDYEYLAQWKWYARKNKRQFYAARSHTYSRGKQKTVFMHCEVAARNGWSGQQIDHRDRNGLNNRRGNLRAATAGQNAANQGLRQDNKSRLKGIAWRHDHQRWRAFVGRGGRSFQREFADFDEAVAWRDAQARELHGEFAYLNGAA